MDNVYVPITDENGTESCAKPDIKDGIWRVN